MKHRLAIFLPLLVTLLIFLGLSHASFAKQNRIALVIGNSAYKTMPLDNPKNDATDMTHKLNRYGFKVKKLIDANQRSMETAIARFGKQLQQKNTVGLFYFAGHGVQVNGTNYLIPIGAHINSEADVRYEAVDAGRILSQMSLADNGLNMLILDACRNNPYARSFRSATRGLARMEAPSGSLILYATSPGDVAADGSGRNGLFTEKLMKVMDKKGLKVEDVFKQTAIAVSKASGKQQVPYQEGVILGNFYFIESVTVNQPALQVAGADPNVASKAEVEFWQDVKKDNSVESYETYLKEYPNGHYTKNAKYKLKRLKRTPVPKPVPQLTTGKLTIRSNVNNDTVLLNGEHKGSTRLDLNLKPGIYALEVKKVGYTTWEKQLDIKTGSEQLVYAKLKRKVPATTTPGSKSSYSRPQTASSGGGARIITDSVTGMELLKVPSGCFQMGSRDTSNKYTNDERPIHRVCISKDFYLGKYEVTQGQWKKIMGSNPSKFIISNNHPVERVSWYDVQEFIRILSTKTGHNYRLPTEAEWEYACRSGGKNQQYCGGNNVNSLGWYDKNSGGTTHPVGQKSPNGIGLYDMSGNVWEWVQDWYAEGYYNNSPTNDPRGPSSGANRVYRGGGWRYFASGLLSTNRDGYIPGYRYKVLGLRLARSF